MSKGTIKKVAGPLVIAEGMHDANMHDVVRVSDQKLIGEIIEMHGDQASIQVYEETSGLGPGEPVESTGVPMSVELGPGLIGSIYDGIQRPLRKILEVTGSNLLSRGIEVPSLDREKVWHFVASAKPGDKVQAGDILGTVRETEIVTQKIMVPYGTAGTVKELADGDFKITDNIGVITDDEGNEVEFEFLDVIEYDGDEYIVLIENDEDADEVVILKINALDEETEEYVSIDDEEILQTVFEMFKKKYEGDINFE